MALSRACGPIRAAREVITRAKFLMIEVIGHQLEKKGSSVRELHNEIQQCGLRCAWKSRRDELYTHETDNEKCFFDLGAEMTKWTLIVIVVITVLSD